MSRAVIIGVGLVLATASLGLGCWIGSEYATTTLTATHKATLARISEANGVAITQAIKDTRAEERRRVLNMATIDAKKFKDLENEIISKDRSIADLRAGNVRMRARFTCPAATSPGGASQAGESTNLGDEGTAAGLQAADGEFLIGIAAEADQAVIQLQACQAIIKADRSGRSEP